MKKLAWGEAVSPAENGYILKVDNKEVRVDESETLGEMTAGESYFIVLWQDETGRSLGSEKISLHLSSTVPANTYMKGQKLVGIVYQRTDLGYKVFFDGEYTGVVFETEVFTELTQGQEVTVYIKNIRDDLKIDLSLQPIGYKAAATNAQTVILQKLAESDGKLNLSDKSSPEEISNVLGISKKKYKEAIGALYKQRKITISNEGINLIKHA